MQGKVPGTSGEFRLVCMVMLRPCCWKCFVISFLILCAWGPVMFLKMASPPSLYGPMLSFQYVVANLLRMKRPTSSQTSAPSKLRACMIMLVSLSVILQYFMANDSAFFSRSSVMDG